MDRTRLLRAGLAYQKEGWPVFVLGQNKVPFGNCVNCREEVPGHAAVCTCLLCHGFYAASLSAERLERQLEAAPQAPLLAVRLGGASGLVVVDAEGDDRSNAGLTGIAALDMAEWDWPQTLRARTPSGGVHLWFRIDGGVRSRGKVLPNVDIKSNGGYVVCSPSADRRWMNWGTPVVMPEAALRAWLENAPGHGAGKGGGSAHPGSAGMRGSLALRTAAVIPAGRRYEFVRDLVYALRRRGCGKGEVLAELRPHWERMEQPPVCAYELPWSQVVYEVERVFWRVEPQPPLAAALAAWMKGVGGSGSGNGR